MGPSLLFVDDEPAILKAVSRLFRKLPYSVLTCETGSEALDLLEGHEVAVLVSDNRMPTMSGLDLLTRAKALSPDTVRIMLTGYADLNTTIGAINQGEVFRFVVKPWDDTALLQAVQTGVERYQLTRSLKGADESKLRSLAQTIELKDPYTRGHCDRVAEYALWIAEELDLGARQRLELKHGSWLHDCGKIGIKDEVLNKEGRLTDAEFAQVKEHPAYGADVAAQAMLSSTIRNIILYHHENMDGSGYPTGLRGENIPLEARIVAIADVYDALTTDRPYRKAFSPEKACDILDEMAGDHLDPDLTRVFLDRVLGRRTAEAGAAAPARA